MLLLHPLALLQALRLHLLLLGLAHLHAVGSLRGIGGPELSRRGRVRGHKRLARRGVRLVHGGQGGIRGAVGLRLVSLRLVNLGGRHLGRRLRVLHRLVLCLLPVLLRLALREHLVVLGLPRGHAGVRGGGLLGGVPAIGRLPQRGTLLALSLRRLLGSGLLLEQRLLCHIRLMRLLLLRKAVHVLLLRLVFVRLVLRNHPVVLRLARLLPLVDVVGDLGLSLSIRIIGGQIGHELRGGRGLNS